MKNRESAQRTERQEALEQPQPALDEHDLFRQAYWRALHELDAVRLRQWEESRLTLPQLRVLFQVLRSPGITTGQLAPLLGITVSTTSGLVTKLVSQGLLERGRAEDDRRQIPLEVTGSGRALAGELAGFSRPFMREVADRLGQDLGCVTEALTRLAETAGQVRAERLSQSEVHGWVDELGSPDSSDEESTPDSEDEEPRGR